MDWARPHATEFALAIGLGLLGALLIARKLAKASDARSVVLLVLRGLAMAVIVAILLDPVRVVETRIPGEKPRAIYLIDGSRSMGLERPTSRIDQVMRWQSQVESAVTPDRRPEISRYRYGRQLAAVPPGQVVKATDDESNLRDALERLPHRFGEAMPTAVFVFSDGRSTETTGFDAVAEGYKKLGVPIHVMPVGDPSISGDVSIRDLILPRDAPQGSKLPVKIVVQSRGFDGRRAEVLIRPAAGKDRKPIASLPLTLLGGEQPADLVIEADRARSPMIAEVVALPGEAVAENNRVPFQVGVRDRKIRVIYMEGSPPPEYRYLRDALVEDPNIECVAIQTDVQSVGKARLYRVDDPSKGYPSTREELFTYDVVICSDISRATFTPDQLAWTVDLVAKRGGGFAMIGGVTSFGSGGWDRTSWDAMIPIDMSGDGVGGASAFYSGPFQVLVAPGAEGHPIWRLVDDPATNREIIARMPQFYGTNLTDRLKPAATLLGLSDRTISGLNANANANRQSAAQAQGKAQRPARAGGSPIFSCQSYGRGRSFAMSTDSTLSWGRDFEKFWGEGDNRHFRKFWRNVVTWLAENSLGAEGRLEVEVDKVLYRPGQPIQVTARAYDESLEPTTRYRLVARLVTSNDKPPASSTRPLGPLAFMTNRPGSQDNAATLILPSVDQLQTPSGSTLRTASVEVTAFDGDRQVGRSIVNIQILDDSEEFRDPRPDRSRLEALARRSGGSILEGPEDLARRLDLPAGSVDRLITSKAPLWDTSAAIGLVCALLTAEWLVRRWKGLA